MNIRPLAPLKNQTECKICGHNAELYGVVDFNKNCEEPKGVLLPLAGIPVYYHQCSQCGLVFTRAFDAWNKSDYLEHIYNDDYVKVDPDYTARRPQDAAELVEGFIEGRKFKMLDYGGGNGMMAGLLRKRGLDCVSWDPMQKDDVRPVSAQFDLITSFEVFEHTPTPVESTQEALEFLKPETGMLLFSTLTIDTLPARAVNFGYFAPRNGHITIYTRKALAMLFARFGYKMNHLHDGLHLAYKTVPQLAR